MIPETNPRVVHMNGSLAGGEFQISHDDQAHLMKILRDTLYSDKILAVLREYGSNAWDAHRDAGKADIPIEITLPTKMDPTLSIRDYGKGLSKEDVFKIYTQYGRSTKRSDNAAVGMLGIGSKSGFAYADSFNIISCHGGVRSTYIACLNENDKGAFNLLHEEPCGDETGVLIQMAIDPHDIPEFHAKAQNLFKYFSPRPKINTTLPPLQTDQVKSRHGVLLSHVSWEERGWTAVMGCIPYRINLDQIRNWQRGVPQYLVEMGGILYFNIGEVQISASREELKYSDATKTVLVERIWNLLEDHIKAALVAVDAATNNWEKRLAAQALARFEQNIPTTHRDLVAGYVYLKDLPKSFELLARDGARFREVDSVFVHKDTRVIIKDDNRSIKGFKLSYRQDIVVRPRKKTVDGMDVPMCTVLSDLNKLLTDSKLDGIKITKTSTLEWQSDRTFSSAAPNIKHKVKMFKWNPTAGREFKAPYSRFWDAEDHTPTDQDVYVEIESFQVLGINMMACWREDEEIAAMLGVSMPVIRAYKVTEKEPQKIRKGVKYTEWRRKLLENLLKDPTFLEQWENWCRQREEGFGYRFTILDSKQVKKVEDALGTNHIISRFFRKRWDSHQIKAKIPHHVIERMSRSHPGFDPKKSQSYKELQEIYKFYPLFTIGRYELDLTVLFEEHSQQFVHYVQTLDKGSK